MLNGINDGFTVSAPEPIFGFGGYLRGTYGADIIMVIDGDEANPVDLGEICELDPMGEPINCIDRNLGNTPFVAVIDPHGFTQIEVRETEGGGDETKYIWSDNFTLGFQTLPSVRTPGTAWAQAVDGTYGVGSNWENSAAPPSTGNAVFQLAAAVPYTVDFAQNQFASQMVVSDDQVVLEMNGFTFALDQANPTRESVIVGELPGDRATLSVRDGALTGVNAVIGHSTGTNGHVTVAAAAEFSLSGQLRIGSGGVGALEVTGGGHVSSNITLVGQLAGQGTLNLNGPGTTLDAGLIMVGQVRC